MHYLCWIVWKTMGREKNPHIFYKNVTFFKSSSHLQIWRLNGGFLQESTRVQKKSMCKVNNKDYANEKLKIMRIFNKRELITRL